MRSLFKRFFYVFMAVAIIITSTGILSILDIKVSADDTVGIPGEETSEEQTTIPLESITTAENESTTESETTTETATVEETTEVATTEEENSTEPTIGETTEPVTEEVTYPSEPNIEETSNFIESVMGRSLYSSPTEIPDAVDEINIVSDDNKDRVLLEWKAIEPNNPIINASNITEHTYWVTTIEWSIKENGKYKAGDYFLIDIAKNGIFIIDDWYFRDATGNCENDKGEVVATYQIISSTGQIKVTLTDFVDTHDEITGNVWFKLFVGSAEDINGKNISFTINGQIYPLWTGTVDPWVPGTGKPYGDYAKWASSHPDWFIIDPVNKQKHYFFFWSLIINLQFNTIENFNFNDVIPDNSPHIFMTPEILAANNITLPAGQKWLSNITIGEYIGSDGISDNQQKLDKYYKHFNAGTWSDNDGANGGAGRNFKLTNGLTIPGYSSTTEAALSTNPGIAVSNLQISPKQMSANLGKITRPTYIQYYTILTVPLTESELSDSTITNGINNTFSVNGSNPQTTNIEAFSATHGGGASGIKGDYGFSFKKLDETDDSPLSGVWFTLYKDIGCTEVGASAQSVSDGTVTFNNIQASTYYMKESSTIAGYINPDTKYKVVLRGTNDFQIFEVGETEPLIYDTQGASSSFIITNEPIIPDTPKPKITINKVDENDEALEGAEFKLTKDDDDTAENFLNAYTTPTATFTSKELELGDYTLTETEAPDGYKMLTTPIRFTVTDEGTITGGGFSGGNGVYTIEIENEPLEPISYTIKGTKKLLDGTDNDKQISSFNADLFEFELVENSTVIQTVKNKADGTYEFAPIDYTHENIGIHTYTVKEVVPAGQNELYTYDRTEYTVTVTISLSNDGTKLEKNVVTPPDVTDDKIIFTNTYDPKPIEITITKIWEDYNDRDGIRKDVVAKAQLYANNEQKGEAILIPQNDGVFHIWRDLPIKDHNGVDITYRVEEEIEAGSLYTLEISEPITDEHGNVSYTFTNTYVPETIDIIVTKLWEHGNNTVLPTEIEVQLYKGDNIEVGEPVTIEPDEHGNWKHEWKELPKNDGGTEIVYKVAEITTVEGYSTSYSEDTFTITNKYNEKISKTVVKTWDDDKDRDGIRPASIQVQLYADGKEYGEAVELKANANNSSQDWRHTWNDLPEKKDDKPIVYTVEEKTTVPGYDSPEYSNDTFTITNTHTPATVSKTVKKIWDDANNQDSKRPISIVVQLSATAGGKSVNINDYDSDLKNSVTLNEANNWTDTESWKVLPKKANGEDIVYTVAEINISADYTVTYDQTTLTITNTHTPEVVSKTATKIWDDANNRDGLRPSSITLQLLSNGSPYRSPVTLNISNGTSSNNNTWAYTWEDLPKYNIGAEIVYTISEPNVANGYTSSVSGMRVTNTLTPASPTVTNTDTTTTTSTTTESSSSTTTTSTTTESSSSTTTTIAQTEQSSEVSSTEEAEITTVAAPIDESETVTVITETPAVLTSETMSFVAERAAILPQIDENNEPSIYTTFTVPALPEGYSMLQLDEGMFEILDENGVPLGYLMLPEGASLEDLTYEDILEMMIPYGEMVLPEPEVKLIVPTNLGNFPVPKTGSVVLFAILGFMSLSLISFLSVAKKRRLFRRGDTE